METDSLPTLEDLQEYDQPTLKALHERLYPGYSHRLARVESG
jgi:hypothetical protein